MSEPQEITAIYRREAIRRVPDLDVATAKLMRLAADFYALYQEHRPPVAAYAPDTQGVFDIASK